MPATMMLNCVQEDRRLAKFRRPEPLGAWIASRPKERFHVDFFERNAQCTAAGAALPGGHPVCTKSFALCMVEDGWLTKDGDRYELPPLKGMRHLKTEG